MNTNPIKLDLEIQMHIRGTDDTYAFFYIFSVYYKSNEWAGVYGIRENDRLKWLSGKN